MFPSSEQIQNFIITNGININHEIIIYDQEGFFVQGEYGLFLRFLDLKDKNT